MKIHFSSSRGKTKSNFSSRISRDRDSCQGLACVCMSRFLLFCLYIYIISTMIVMAIIIINNIMVVMIIIMIIIITLIRGEAGNSQNKLDAIRENIFLVEEG